MGSSLVTKPFCGEPSYGSAIQTDPYATAIPNALVPMWVVAVTRLVAGSIRQTNSVTPLVT